MKLIQDSQRYDEFQIALIKEITQTISVKLVEAGLHGPLMENTAANIAFSIASILDDTTMINAGSDEVHPYLTFRAGENNDLVHCGENAYTYEFVTGILKEMFEG